MANNSIFLTWDIIIVVNAIKKEPTNVNVWWEKSKLNHEKNFHNFFYFFSFLIESALRMSIPFFLSFANLILLSSFCFRHIAETVKTFSTTTKHPSFDLFVSESLLTYFCSILSLSIFKSTCKNTCHLQTSGYGGGKKYIFCCVTKFYANLICSHTQLNKSMLFCDRLRALSVVANIMSNITRCVFINFVKLIFFPLINLYNIFWGIF